MRVEDIYKMKLHDTYRDSYFMVLRVPGGWMYTSYTEGEAESSVFVPFNNEFM
jgi:hypothetical protein